jgi:hypothetical protein
MNYFEELYRKVKKSPAVSMDVLDIDTEKEQLRILVTLFPNVNLEFKRILLTVRDIEILRPVILKEIDNRIKEILHTYKNPNRWQVVELSPWRAFKFALCSNDYYGFLLQDL